MPMAVALRLCPQAIIVPPRMERYAEVSQQVLAILEKFTPLIEPISIDEAFLDVTGSTRLLGSAEEMAAELKRRIYDATNLTASVGVAPNKFLAKLASDSRKPDGLVVVAPDGVHEFLVPLPIARLWGVGKATLPEFERMSIRTFGDALRLSASDWRREFGEHGARFHELIRGIDERPVVPDRAAKSISHEITFPEDIGDFGYLRAVVLDQTDAVARRLRRSELLARNVGLKIRSGDFTTITRRATIPDTTDQTETLWQAVSGLFETWTQQKPPPVRLIGVGASQLSSRGGEQLSLFHGKQDEWSSNLDRAMDAIRDRFGKDAISRGVQRPPMPQ